MAKITIYKNSPLATLCSLLGYILAMTGVALALTGTVAVGLLLIGIGVVLLIAAESVSSRKQFSAWKSKLEEKGLVPAIGADVQTAVLIYNTNPGKRTLKYIESLNPEAARFITEQLKVQKSAKKKKD